MPPGPLIERARRPWWPADDPRLPLAGWLWVASTLLGMSGVVAVLARDGWALSSTAAVAASALIAFGLWRIPVSADSDYSLECFACAAMAAIATPGEVAAATVAAAIILALDSRIACVGMALVHLQQGLITATITVTSAALIGPPGLRVAAVIIGIGLASIINTIVLTGLLYDRQQVLHRMSTARIALAVELTIALPLALLVTYAHAQVAWSPLLMASPMLAVVYLTHLGTRTSTAERDAVDARRAALIDSLTQLRNRRAFTDAMAAPTPPASVLMIDVDHFKQLNDTRGHDVGDTVLTEVARALEAALVGEAAVPYRFGGEEFAVLVSDPMVDPASLGEEVRAMVAFRLAEFKVTVSVGTAMVQGSVDAALRAADEALYESKHAGRNRVTRARTHAHWRDAA